MKGARSLELAARFVSINAEGRTAHWYLLSARRFYLLMSLASFGVGALAAALAVFLMRALR